jgi:4-azaleucine resistance transporter AzlC
MRAAGGNFKTPGVPPRRRGRIAPAPFPCPPAPLQLPPQFLAAVKACLPVLPGVLTFGAISGVAMVAAGMPNYQALAMSVLVYAGNAQLAALQLVTSGSPFAIAILAALVINLRFSIYSLSLAPEFAAVAPRWRPLLSYLLTDNGYAVTLRGYERELTAAGKVWYYSGCSAAIWVAWQIGTLLGVLLGARIPSAWHLEFSIVLTLLGIVAPSIRDRALAAAAGAAGITAVLAWPLPLRLGLLLAAAAGITAGMLVESMLQKKPR